MAAGTYLDSDLIARVTLRGGKSCLEERCSHVENSASVTLQKFVANSFFVEAGGMAQRSIYHMTAYDNGAWRYDRDYGYTYSAQTAGGTFALGNQWQYGDFTLGVRWVQIYQAAFSREGKVHADRDGRTVGKSQKDQLRKLEREFKLYLPSLALGLSF